MSDIATVLIDSSGQADWSISDGALASGDDLSSAVFISLFSDRQAEASDDLPDTSGDRRGWWGDLDESAKVGSRLWLLSRSRLDDAVAKDAVTYAKEALKWLIDDGVATSVSVAATRSDRKLLTLRVIITKRDGTTASLSYAWAWDQLTN